MTTILPASSHPVLAYHSIELEERRLWQLKYIRGMLGSNFLTCARTNSDLASIIVILLLFISRSCTKSWALGISGIFPVHSVNADGKM